MKLGLVTEVMVPALVAAIGDGEHAARSISEIGGPVCPYHRRCSDLIPNSSVVSVVTTSVTTVPVTTVPVTTVPVVVVPAISFTPRETPAILALATDGDQPMLGSAHIQRL